MIPMTTMWLIITGVLIGFTPALGIDKTTTQSDCEKWGKSYPDKTEVCIKGSLNRCEGGVWKDLGKKCVDTKPSCQHDSKGYPENSKVCFEGTIHRCELGHWNDLGTACEQK